MTLKKRLIWALIATAVIPVFSWGYSVQGQKPERKADQTKSVFLEGFLTAASVQIQIETHLREAGRLPSGNWELGIAKREDYSGQFVGSLEVSNNGTIIVSLYGEYGQLILRPEMNVYDGKLIWQCFSNSVADISLIFPSCKFNKTIVPLTHTLKIEQLL